MSLPQMVVDRTAEDVADALRLTSTPYAKLSQSDRAKLSTSLKGAYNTTDLTRVTEAVQFLVALFESRGYHVPNITIKSWAENEIPSAEQLTQYLDNIKNLRNTISVLPSTPPAPQSMAHLTHVEANAIEQILVDLDMLLAHMESTWFYAGDVFSGEIN